MLLFSLYLPYQLEYLILNPLGYSMNITLDDEEDGGPTKQEISKSTTQLVRRLLLMTQNLDPLPEHAYITIR